jgi:hypothetical protein
MTNKTTKVPVVEKRQAGGEAILLTVAKASRGVTNSFFN